jgi:ubiquinol-cytochrome c reductase cytochrome c1 subunit
MRELKILIVLIVFTLITYYGIEPFAHHEMSPAVAPASFDVAAEDEALASKMIATSQAEIAKQEKLAAKYQDATSDEGKKAYENAMKAAESARAELAVNEERKSGYQELWAHADEVMKLTGDAERGSETFDFSCAACHGAEAGGKAAPADAATESEAYGVAVPDLSNATAAYDKKFLIGLIIDPTRALKVDHKFNDDRPFPMTPFGGVNEDFNQDVADIVAYLESIASADISGEAIFEEACVRCHDMRYAKLYSPTLGEPLAAYAGSNPPDLSMMIRSRGASYLETFINDPQKNIAGTAMPRVGLKADAQAKLITYMEEVGDSKKGERGVIGLFLMGFFAIMAVLAYLWKREVWKDLH